MCAARGSHPSLKTCLQQVRTHKDRYEPYRKSKEHVLIKLKPEDWPKCGRLFDGYRRERSFIDTTFEGYFDGFKDYVVVSVDDAVSPRIAKLKVGNTVLLGGDSSSTSLGEICSSISVANSYPHWSSEFTGELLTPENEEWNKAILGVTKRAVLTQRRKAYSARFLDLAHLSELKTRLRPGFELRRFDEQMAMERGIDVERMGMSFFSLRQFLDRGGISFWILKDGESVSEATSVGMSKSSIEVGVGTDERFQKLGLATVVSAALLSESIKSGKEPHWGTTENPRSDGLALKLGYKLHEEYDLIGFSN